ncbi:RHS repeat-associated core domain-containing protein [Pseudomonas sp. C32]|uniref:RHS repeat-associated core domain-containing protein n=1 Tax=Pseudomonas sp. C32 TaxID=1529208 RepID=UPI002603769B|nr:RHS repeat-associated core domain-containing protein [Pseudomonas sp. C32]MDN4546484.1 RHS repeat-associated core domain-containing protein [Pseudomonas sp. C32]
MPSNRETLLCQYRYDPLDRLVASTPSAQSDAQRFYLKDRLATEIQGALQCSIMQHDDQLLAQQQRQNGTAQTRLLATDQQRSVLNVLDATRPHPLAYSPYGLRHPGNGLLSLLGFNGERPDPVTGCYLLGNGYRAFNPVLMRFNSSDSWSPFGEGGLNGYAYCVGDPVNRKDQTGHASWSALMAKHFSRALNAAKKSPKSARLLPAKPTPRNIAVKKELTLNDMPNEIINKIADYVPGNSLAKFAATSKRMHGVAYSEVRQKHFIKYIDRGTSPQERLMRLGAVGQGTVPGLLPAHAIETGYTHMETITTITEINRRPYLATFERVQAQQRAERLERVSQEIRASHGDIW